MADDSLEYIEEFDFHPGNSPRGMLYYDFSILEKKQQESLNDLKMKIRKDNEIYLRRHPEVRGLIVIILKFIMRVRPRSKIPQLVFNYLWRYRSDVEDAVEKYVEELLKGRPEQEDEILDVIDLSTSEISINPEEISADKFDQFDEESVEDVPYAILNEIIEAALDKLNISVDSVDFQDEDISAEEFVKNLIHDEMDKKIQQKLEGDMRQFIEDEIIKQVLASSSFAVQDEKETKEEPSHAPEPQQEKEDILSTVEKEDIQSTVEDIQSTVEDIQSTVEDILSTAEDIQSTVENEGVQPTVEKEAVKKEHTEEELAKKSSYSSTVLSINKTEEEP